MSQYTPMDATRAHARVKVNGRAASGLNRISSSRLTLCPPRISARYSIHPERRKNRHHNKPLPNDWLRSSKQVVNVTEHEDPYSSTRTVNTLCALQDTNHGLESVANKQ